MKKQILILTFFVAAILVGNNAFGQTFTPEIADGNPDPYVNFVSNSPDCAPVIPLSCIDSFTEVEPQAGIQYTYTVTTSDADGDDQIHWFVVDNQTNIISVINDITGMAAAGVIDPGDGTGDFIASINPTTGVYNVPAQTANTIDITWQYFDGNTDVVLLVAYVVDVDDCTDNIEVYRIKPKHSFTLDLAAIDDAGSLIADTANYEECVSPIESAVYSNVASDDPGEGTLTVDYGENWIFFTVTAANWRDSWQPTFNWTYTGGVGDAITVEWAYPADAVADASWNAVTNGTASPTAVVPQGGVSAVDTAGQCIIVRVRVDHGTTNENAEALTQTLNIAVDGVMEDPVAGDYSNAALGDLHYADCTVDGFDNDWANYDLTPRPQIESATGTPTLPFELNTGDPNNPNFGNN